MFRKVVGLSIFFVLMACPIVVHAQPAAPQSSAQQQNAQTRSVRGTVTAIATDGKAFAMSVPARQSRTMQFVIDGHTQVQGRVGVGTKALVQYRPTKDGRNLALNVVPQTSK